MSEYEHLFANGTEFLMWQERNCFRCTKCNGEAEKPEDTCFIEWELSTGDPTEEAVTRAGLNGERWDPDAHPEGWCPSTHVCPEFVLDPDTVKPVKQPHRVTVFLRDARGFLRSWAGLAFRVYGNGNFRLIPFSRKATERAIDNDEDPMDYFVVGPFLAAKLAFGIWFGVWL